MNSRAKLLLVVALLTVAAALAQDTEQPARTDEDFKCIQNQALCLPDEQFSITKVFGIVDTSARTWQNRSTVLAATAGALTNPQKQYLAISGLNDEEYQRACVEGYNMKGVSKEDQPQIVAWVILVLAFLVILVFGFLESPTVLKGITKDPEGATMNFVKGMVKLIAPRWKTSDIINAPDAEELLNSRVKAAKYAADGRILVSIAQKGDKGSKIKLEEASRNIVGATVMDSIHLFTAAVYAVSITIFFWVAYWMMDFFRGSSFLGVNACTFTGFKIIVAVMWAFWIWEIIKYTVVRSAFILTMFLPPGLTKFIFVLFTGGGIGTGPVIMLLAFPALFGMLTAFLKIVGGAFGFAATSGFTSVLLKGLGLATGATFLYIFLPFFVVGAAFGLPTSVDPSWLISPTFTAIATIMLVVVAIAKLVLGVPFPMSRVFQIVGIFYLMRLFRPAAAGAVQNIGAMSTGEFSAYISSSTVTLLTAMTAATFLYVLLVFVTLGWTAFTSWFMGILTPWSWFASGLKKLKGMAKGKEQKLPAQKPWLPPEIQKRLDMKALPPPSIPLRSTLATLSEGKSIMLDKTNGSVTEVDQSKVGVMKTEAGGKLTTGFPSMKPTESLIVHKDGQFNVYHGDGTPGGTFMHVGETVAHIRGKGYRLLEPPS